MLWLAAVIGYTVAGTASDGDDGEHDFIVLTVKEETVKDYNTMPVFTELARMTGKDVYWTYNTSNQYSNNIDPISIKGIDAIYHAGFSNLKLYNYGRRGNLLLSTNTSTVCLILKEYLKTRFGRIYARRSNLPTDTFIRFRE